MEFKSHTIVLHKSDTNVIGILIGTNVEWWSISKDSLVAPKWTLYNYSSYIKPNTISLTTVPRFKKRCKDLGVFTLKIYKEDDSLVVRKIKELDYKWELKMQEKGNFFLTSRALNVDQETTLQSTPTDTATASDATTTSPLPPFMPEPPLFWTTSSSF